MLDNISSYVKPVLKGIFKVHGLASTVLGIILGIVDNKDP